MRYLNKTCKLKLNIRFLASYVFQDTGLPSFADELAARIKGETPNKPEADRTCTVMNNIWIELFYYLTPFHLSIQLVFFLKFICVHALVCSQALSSGPSITQKKSKTKKESKPQGMSDRVFTSYNVCLSDHTAKCTLPVESLGSVYFYSGFLKVSYDHQGLIYLKKIYSENILLF